MNNKPHPVRLARPGIKPNIPGIIVNNHSDIAHENIGISINQIYTIETIQYTFSCMGLISNWWNYFISNIESYITNK